MVTYFDLRQAAVAFESFTATYNQPEYIPDDILAELTITPPQDSRSARTVIVTLDGAHDRLVEFNYQEFFDTWGATRNINEMIFSGSLRTFEVEYFDLRAPSLVTAALHNHACQGVTFYVWQGISS
ncbi:hypothetical protein BDB00DRAFT_843863 [Zychaea mexicana]|uniref:uncharacterized protein n=1 Tax=Zychaea mexicana TaxID=64656 RepID=UPI0022FF3B76|nr:uncharacterized protein BDB00DRAFT_843863 [Zychaea mexicana]KAI9489316.1 hypothetical protein BDB00DRAFT_843863 [Zychaea mexicana]